MNRILIILTLVALSSCNYFFREGYTKERSDIYGMQPGQFLQPHQIALDDKTGKPDLKTYYLYVDSIDRIETKLRGRENIKIMTTEKMQILDISAYSLDATEAMQLLEHFKKDLKAKPQYIHSETKDSLGQFLEQWTSYNWHNVEVGDYYDVTCHQKAGEEEKWHISIINLRVKEGELKRNKK